MIAAHALALDLPLITQPGIAGTKCRLRTWERGRSRPHGQSIGPSARCRDAREPRSHGSTVKIGIFRDSAHPCYSKPLLHYARLGWHPLGFVGTRWDDSRIPRGTENVPDSSLASRFEPCASHPRGSPEGTGRRFQAMFERIVAQKNRAVPPFSTTNLLILKCFFGVVARCHSMSRIGEKHTLSALLGFEPSSCRSPSCRSPSVLRAVRERPD